MVDRNPKDYDFKHRPDKVGKYYTKYMKNFVFDEFSETFIGKEGKISFMKGVPIPLREEDLTEFKGGGGIKISILLENMAWVLGIDPKFKHRDAYILFIEAYHGKKASINIVKVGRNAAEREEYDKALIHFRAALCLTPQDLHAMYSYAKVCRAIYLAEGSEKDEEFVGTLKAESIKFFELIIDFHPRYAQSYYYLGYAYLNMGLYIKTALTWERFLALSRNNKDKKEIRKRLTQIAHPMEIENGYNAILAGRYVEGVSILEPFKDSKFKDWWPLHYYLGVGYAGTDRQEDALESFKGVLALNGSHVETMDELVTIYRKKGDGENEKKYAEKAKLLRSGGYK